MILRVDPASPVPPYEQVRSQIATMIATGVLPVGARLPAIRQLSKDLGLAGGTVARAYRELESEGLIGGRGRRGTFVIADRSSRPAGTRDEELLEAARAFAVQARQLGVDPSDALQTARRALDSMPPA